MRSHRPSAPKTVALDDVDFAAVTHLILVDVRRTSRLEGIEPLLARVRAGDPGLRVTVYEHHESAPDDVPAHVAFVERVGAATTLLVEHIRARGLRLDVVETTLFGARHSRGHGLPHLRGHDNA